LNSLKIQRQPIWQQALVVLTVLTVTPRAVASADAVVEVTQQEKLVDVVGSILIPADRPCVLATITDYESLPTFIPQLASSRIVESRSDTSFVVEQTSVSKFLFHKRTAYARFVATHSPNGVRTRFLEGDFHHHETEWEWVLETKKNGTRLRYGARIRSVYRAPGWVIRRMVKRSVRETLEAIRAETIRRATQGAPCDDR